MWTASRDPGVKLLGAGGKLVLTTKRLLYEPMRTPKEALLGPVARFFGLGDIAGLVKCGIDATGSLGQWAAPLEAIAQVFALEDDQVEVRMRSGETWKFRIAAGLYALPGSRATVAQREEAVATIQGQLSAAGAAHNQFGGRSLASFSGAASATASSLPRPRAPTLPGADAATYHPDDSMDVRVTKARLSASVLGRAQVVLEEGPMRLYVVPDGSVHAAYNYPPRRPAHGTHPAELVGKWRYGGAVQDDEYIVLDVNGSISGYVALFGGLPPLPVAGEWWFDPGSALITPAVQVAGPAGLLDDDYPTVFEGSWPVQLKSVGRDVVVVGMHDPESGETEGVTFHRAALSGA